MAAWQRLHDREALTDRDGEGLAELVRVQASDDPGTRSTREALFGALWRLGTQGGLVA